MVHPYRRPTSFDNDPWESFIDGIFLFFYVGIDYYHRSCSSQAILEPKVKLDAELGTEEERTLIIGYISLTASAMK